MDISIIIPTFNRAGVLEKTLLSFLKNKDDNIKFEIIIVDNNSTDNTKFIVDKYSEILPTNYLFESRQGKNYAVNKGIRFSSGDILVFIDDDVSIGKSWFNCILKSTQNNPDLDIFGGKILTQWPDSTPGWVYYSSSNFPYLFCDHSLGEQQIYYDDSPLPAGANFWMRKSLLKKYNVMFNVNYGPSGGKRISGSETEFLKRMYNNGVKMLYVPEALVYHRVLPCEFELSRLLHRFFSAGKSAVVLSSEVIPRRSLFGIPLYTIRQNLEELVVFIFFLLLLNKKKYMNSLIKISYFWGKMNGYFNRCK